MAYRTDILESSESRTLGPLSVAPLESTRAGRAAARIRRLDAASSGPRREPLVLIHPFALCAEVWRPILPLLKRHHDVHTLAIPGHHGSDPLPPGYQYSIEKSVDLLEAKLDALGIERAHIVGNSLGGWLAIELARRGRALSVVALAPGGGWELGSPEHKRLIRRFKMTRRLLTLGGPIATRLVDFGIARACLLRDAVAHPARLTANEARLLIERTWRCAAYDDIMEAMPTQPVSEPFEQMPCPIRLVWGTEDRLLPMRGYSERWRRMIPEADFVVLPNVGHVQMYDDPLSVVENILDVTTRREATAEARLAS